ncbi:MAG: hypothetical protein KAW47_08755, partial [Thermoplasmatales archaeon]|nr:hypothetical protein [Thermoplasmatales archaeon]
SSTTSPNGANVPQRAINIIQVTVGCRNCHYDQIEEKLRKRKWRSLKGVKSKAMNIKERVSD